jgi:hypothetical protein
VFERNDFGVTAVVADIGGNGPGFEAVWAGGLGVAVSVDTLTTLTSTATCQRAVWR